MSIVLTLIFEIIFILNLFLFWLVFLKRNEYPGLHSLYKSIFPYIWTISLVCTLIFNSNFLQFIFPINFSYLQDLWIWFLLLGIVLIVVGIKVISMVRKVFKVKGMSSDESILITKGPYALIRHPIYLAWILIFTGWAFILDSPLAIIFIPVLILLLWIHSIYEERYILLPEYGDRFLQYCKKVPYRIFSTPYNYIIIIIGIVVGYLGLINWLFSS